MTVLRKAVRLAAIAAAPVLAISMLYTVPAAAANAAPPLKVSGDHIVNATTGAVVQLRGVNESSWSNACHNGGGQLWHGGAASTAADPAMWAGVNAIDLKLNEDCWLGINGYPTGSLTAAQYRAGVAQAVTSANAAGLEVILTLAASAPGTTKSSTQNIMADQDHSPTFWNQVAAAFKGNQSVLFELYNEPRPDNGANNSTAAACVRNGGAGVCSDGQGWTTAGMQELTTSIRNDGAPNIILEGGPHNEGDPNLWRQYIVSDPGSNLALTWHAYPNNACNTLTCYNTVLKGIADAGHPVVGSEMGGSTSASPPSATYPTHAVNWMDTGSLTKATGGTPIDGCAISAIGFVYDTQFGGSDNMLSAWPATAISPYGTTWKSTLSHVPTCPG